MKGYLDFNDILNEIKSLAKSQGFYGRLYRELMENEDYKEDFKTEIEKQKFKDTLDFILWLEC